jgi:NAD(P)-dependent dehydrogenase (short-subunit alcohol dehydrogenase family)
VERGSDLEVQSVQRLKDRVAIVTGAGGGVGEGVARAFAAEGARVAIANRTEKTGRAVAASIEEDFADCGAKALYVQTDVSQEDSVRSMVDTTVRELGRVDVLVNNATPAGGMARLERLTQEAMEEHVHVNYYGAFWAMQAAFPHMKAGGHGRVVNMCSLNGINAHRYTTAYNASKEALRALTRTAAVEWARYGITCNVLCPSAVSPPWQAFERWAPDRSAELLESVPMGRMGDAEHDIGPVAVFLASDESRFVTGNTIHADGGGHINGVAWKFELPES